MKISESTSDVELVDQLRSEIRELDDALAENERTRIELSRRKAAAVAQLNGVALKENCGPILKLAR